MIDPHILNLYEAFDLKISQVFDIFKRGLRGDLQNLSEKIDGQNFTFLVVNKNVRFIGKGCPTWTVDRGGLSITETVDNFKDKPHIANAFKEIMHLLNGAIPAFEIDLEGKYVVSEIVVPENSNVLRYKKKMLIVHGIIDDNKIKPIKFKDKILNGWLISSQIKPVFLGCLEEQLKIIEIDEMFKRLKIFSGCHGDPTIGDISLSLIIRQLKISAPFLHENELLPAAKRLLYEDPKFFGRKNFKTNERWLQFRKIDDDRIKFLALSLLQIERTIQKLSTFIIEAYDFQSIDAFVDIEKHAQFIKDVKAAYAQGNIDAPSDTLDKISVAIERIDESLLTRNVEGLVFEFNERLFKFAGVFPAFNRLHGYFKYGTNPARITYGR